MLYQLIYHSQAASSLHSDDVKDIMNTALEFNQKNNLTGVLIKFKGEFLQLIEGEYDVVRDLYSRIEQDHRHHSVQLLMFQATEERLYDNWSMKYFKVKLNQVETLGKTIGLEGLNNLKIISLNTQPKVLDLFKHLDQLGWVI